MFQLICRYWSYRKSKLRFQELNSLILTLAILSNFIQDSSPIKVFEESKNLKLEPAFLGLFTKYFKCIPIFIALFFKMNLPKVFFPTSKAIFLQSWKEIN